jgi:hypothetical protein
MKRSVSAIVAILVLVPVVAMAQTPYSQDFEALPMVDGSLAGDGWLVYGNIFDPAWNYLWGHGPWPAPNNQTPGNWEDITTGQGGPEQGDQQLVQYSDYGNAEHGNGNWVESLLFQEQSLAADASGTWCFQFDAKHGDLAGASMAFAFIKTIDPNAGWAQTSLTTMDMTYLPVEWGTYTISLDVAPFPGQLIQFGFATQATNYEPCGVFYDNVYFYDCSPSPVEETTWGAVKALYQ